MSLTRYDRETLDGVSLIVSDEVNDDSWYDLLYAVTTADSRTARVPSGLSEMSGRERHRSTSLHLARR
jgi:hypothetical protein